MMAEAPISSSQSTFSSLDISPQTQPSTPSTWTMRAATYSIRATISSTGMVRSIETRSAGACAACATDFLMVGALTARRWSAVARARFSRARPSWGRSMCPMLFMTIPVVWVWVARR